MMALMRRDPSTAPDVSLHVFDPVQWIVSIGLFLTVPWYLMVWIRDSAAIGTLLPLGDWMILSLFNVIGIAIGLLGGRMLWNKGIWIRSMEGLVVRDYRYSRTFKPSEIVDIDVVEPILGRRRLVIRTVDGTQLQIKWTSTILLFLRGVGFVSLKRVHAELQTALGAAKSAR